MAGVSPSQAQIQEQARRAGVVRSLHHLISWLQSTLLGLAAGVAFKLCLFGGEPCRAPLHWLALLGCGVSSALTLTLTSPFPIWTVGHAVSVSAAPASCSLGCDIATLRIRGIHGHGPFLKIKQRPLPVRSTLVDTHNSRFGQDY